MRIYAALFPGFGLPAFPVFDDIICFNRDAADAADKKCFYE